MDSVTYVKALSALVAWREENRNGVLGMLGVLFVIRARANARWEQGDWDKIITDRNQFSSISILGDGQTVHWPDPRDPSFVKVLQAVDGIYEGTTPDTITNGALWYCDGQVIGPWFKTYIIDLPDLHPRCATIGTTSYYK